jgi:hypothetical protein
MIQLLPFFVVNVVGRRGENENHSKNKNKI